MSIPPIFTWVMLATAPAQQAELLDLRYKECRVLYERAVKSGIPDDMAYVRAVCSVRSFKDELE